MKIVNAIIILLLSFHSIKSQILYKNENRIDIKRNNKNVASYTLKNNQLNGDFTQHYPNGLIQCQGYYNTNTQKGEQYWYYLNDKLRKIVEYTMTFPVSHNFINYSLEETITEFWENGKNKSVLKYKNGQKQTEFSYWYSNGNLKQETKLTSHGNHFIYSEYFENGQKKLTRTFLINENNSIQDGLYQEWNDKGVLIKDANVINNKSNGYSHIWSENGQMTEEYLYKDNVIIAQKMWSKEGKEILSYDTRDVSNKINYVEFYPDKKTLKVRSFNKTYPVEDSMINITFIEEFNDRGALKKCTPIYNRTSASGWFKNSFTNVTCLVAMFVKDSLIISGFRNSSLEALISKVKDENFFVIKLSTNPGYNGRYFSQTITLPTNASEKNIEKKVHNQFKQLEKQFTNPERTNLDYLNTEEKFKLIEPFYLMSIKKFDFDSVAIIKNLDSNGSGSFSVKYKNSPIHFEGKLKDGLFHGINILYLNENEKLFEGNYSYGLQHGEFTEWYPNGLIASLTNYRFNKKKEETIYYVNGGKKTKNIYGINDRPIKKNDWYENGNIKSEMTVVNTPKWGEYQLIEEWYVNGSVKSFGDYKDSVLQVGHVFEDGKIKGYIYSDFKKQIYISKNIQNGREYMDIKIPQEIGEIFNFDYQKYGFSIKGKVTRKAPSLDWKLEDVFGEKTQVDFSQLIFPESLPCDCQDWKEHHFYRTALNTFTDETNFSKYQLNFHTPLKILPFIGGSPFGNEDPPKHYVPMKKYEFSSTFNVMKEVVIALPDSNGILFSLSPCISKYAFSSYRISGSFKFGVPTETSFTIWDPKTLGLTFNAKFLRQVDENKSPIKTKSGTDIPGVLLFNAKKVEYNSEKELDVAEPKLLCSRALEVTGTGIIILINQMLPDLSTKFNYSEMNAIWGNDKIVLREREEKLKVPKNLIEKFRGAFLLSSDVIIPGFNNDIENQMQFNGKDIIIGSDYIIGTLIIKAKKFTIKKYSIQNENGEKLFLEEESLTLHLKKLGFNNFYFQYDPENAQFQIHFFYTKS